ncbi:MAG: hypothetical protein AB7F22_25795 [Reyranella sp.]|uniref:hypothetical protein n=1 Tax=Reyranella sp. TaxID=1929291 RepID=UPI003D0AA9ED
MTLTRSLLVAALTVLVPSLAWPQDMSVEFRLAAAPGNISGCIRADPQFTRVHAFTLKGGQAEVRAPGGIDTKLKLTKPNVYETDYQLGQLHLHVVTDLAATPPSLTVTEKNLGCKWMGVKK